MTTKKLKDLRVIYDFACSADDYLLNRNPQLFKDTRPFIDTFHAAGHVCEHVYRLKNYPHLKTTNTSSSESFNRFIQQFRSQVAYMKLEMATKYLLVIIGARNHIENKKQRKKNAVTEDIMRNGKGQHENST